MRIRRCCMLVAALVIVVAGLPQPGSWAAGITGPVGAPLIGSENPSVARIEGGELVTVMGSGFTSDMTVTLGDAIVDGLTVVDSGHLTFRVPRQKAPGRRTLTVRNGAGFDQGGFRIVPTPLGELAPCEITTVAGGLPDVGDRGGRDSGRILISPYRVAIDAHRNVFVADGGGHRIRRIDGDGGTVWTLAGCGRKGFDGEGVPAVIAALDVPRGVAVDVAGNLFFTDTGNNRVRRVDAVTGVITTVAGTGAVGFSGDGGPGVEAALNTPDDVATDSAGNVYFSDAENFRVRRVDAATGVITTVAGAGNSCGEGNGDGGPATAACLFPSGIDVDALGNLFVCDRFRNQIRRVDHATGLISTAAGSGALYDVDYDDGPALDVALDAPFDVDVAADGTIYLTDGRPTDFDYIGQCSIRRIDPETGLMAIVMFDDGYYSGLAVDDASNLYFVDTEDASVRVINASSGLISDFVANAPGRSYAPGNGTPATECNFGNIQDVDADPQGNLYVLEGGFFAPYTVNRVDAATGATERVRFVPDSENTYDGLGLAVGRAGRVYVGESHFFQPGDVRRAAFDAVGSRIVFGGGTKPVKPGRKGTKVVVDAVYDVAIGGDGTLVIATDRTGIVTFDTGTGRISDVLGLFAFHVALDASDRLYLSQPHTVSAVRRGVALRFAGNGTDGYSGDGGSSTLAAFEYIRGIGLDRAGNLFILTGNRVRRVDATTQVVSTIAGGAGEGYTGDGGPASDALFSSPSCLAVDRDGNVYVGSRDGTVRAIRAGCAP